MEICLVNHLDYQGGTIVYETVLVKQIKADRPEKASQHVPKQA